MKPDGRYRISRPAIEVDTELRSQEEQVREMKGNVIIPAAVVLGIITAVTGIITTGLTVQHNAANPGTCLTKDEFNESMRVRDEQLRARLDGIETSVTLLLVRTDPKR